LARSSSPGPRRSQSECRGSRCAQRGPSWFRLSDSRGIYQPRPSSSLICTCYRHMQRAPFLYLTTSFYIILYFCVNAITTPNALRTPAPALGPASPVWPRALPTRSRLARFVHLLSSCTHLSTPCEQKGCLVESTRPSLSIDNHDPNPLHPIPQSVPNSHAVHGPT